jgi:transcriptional regulator with XRE-family HTH domain
VHRMPRSSTGIAARIGERIERIRVASKRPRRDVADAAELDRSQLWRIEKGHSSAPNETLERIAKALRVPVGAFFDDADAVAWSGSRAGLAADDEDSAKATKERAADVLRHSRSMRSAGQVV